MYTINKSFNIAYGHSVWAQSLNPRFSIETNCACKFFHGHNADVTLFVESTDVDYKGMVIDFKELAFFKKFLDAIIDHKMILDINDPALPIFFPKLSDNLLGSLGFHEDGNYFSVLPHIYAILTDREKQIYDGLVVVSFIPTAENLAKWLFEYAQKYLGDFAKVKKVQLWETPKCCAEYSI